MQNGNQDVFSVQKAWFCIELAKILQIYRPDASSNCQGVCKIRKLPTSKVEDLFCSSIFVICRLEFDMDHVCRTCRLYLWNLPTFIWPRWRGWCSTQHPPHSIAPGGLQIHVHSVFHNNHEILAEACVVLNLPLFSTIDTFSSAEIPASCYYNFFS